MEEVEWMRAMWLSGGGITERHREDGVKMVYDQVASFKVFLETNNAFKLVNTSEDDYEA